jgi:hypothetical protein
MTKMNDNKHMDSTIARSMDARIKQTTRKVKYFG